MVSDVVHPGEIEFNELEKMRRNAEYLAKIDRSIQQLSEARVIVKTIEELEDMAK